MPCCHKGSETSIGSKLKKIDAIKLVFLMMLCSGAVASVPSLNQCPDMVFTDSIEDDSMPSSGSGGGFPGNFTRTITMGNDDHTFYYYIPSSYQPADAMPMMVLWSGAVFAGGGPAAAQDMIDYWQATAETHDFIIVSQAIIGTQNCDPCGWVPASDLNILDFILADMDSRYNIENARKYVWGFSAGGFVQHENALSHADYYAAYAISGAHLGYANSVGTFPSTASREIPVYLSVGQFDGHHAAALSDVSTFTADGWQLNHNIWFEDFVGGHQLPNDVPGKAWDKICISTNLE